MLFYNADLFAQEGIAPPTADWTWDDMLETAIRIAEPDAVPPTYGLLVVDPLPLIYQHGGSLVDDAIAPTHFTLNSPETVEAISWIVDLDRHYGISPPLDRIARHEGEAFTTVHDGRVAMWISPMSFRHYVGSGTTWPFQWGAAPLPQERYRATVGTVEGIAILKNAANPRACWDFVRYSATHLPAGAGPLPYLPALRSLAESQQYLSRMPDKGVDAYALSLPALVPPLNLPGGVSYQLSQILQRSLGPVFIDERTVQEAMEAAQNEADRTLMPELMQ
jgi:multiple sugar transport system substrate-binding protein